MNDTVSLALLAGGRSLRLGEDKAFASFSDGTVIEWMRDRFSGLFPNTFLVIRDPARFQHLGMPGGQRRAHRGGLHSGALHGGAGVAHRPGDLPGVSTCPSSTPRFLRVLAEKSEGYDVFVPRHGEYMQPLCAVYSKAVLNAYLEFIRSGRRRIFDIYPDFNTGYLEMDGGEYGDPDALFMNINTPVELEAARQAGGGGGRGLARGAPAPHPGLHGQEPATGRVVHRQEEVRQDHGGARGHQRAAQPRLPGGGHEARHARLRGRRAGHRLLPHAARPGPRWSASLRPTSTCGSATPQEERPLDDLVRQIVEPVDLVITEGFKKQDAPKIEVSRRARSSELVSTPDELIGITSDQTFPDYPVPQFALDDFSGLADLIEERILGSV